MQAEMSRLPEPAGWSERTVLITGSTSGTGLRAAERFLALGANVVINGRDSVRAQAIAAALNVEKGRIAVSVGDCAHYEQARRVIEFAVERFGGLDVLVSAGASGIGDPKPFAQMSPEEIISGFVTRYQARLFPVRAAIEHLRGRVGANVVMLTTDAGRHATIGESVVGGYAASIIQMTKTLARELSRERIRVNAVSMTLTSGSRSWDRIFGSESFQSRLFSKVIGRFPFGAPPTTDDVADAVAFLASPRATQVTGQTISVNGGLSYGGW